MNQSHVIENIGNSTKYISNLYFNLIYQIHFFFFFLSASIPLPDLWAKNMTDKIVTIALHYFEICGRIFFITCHIQPLIFSFTEYYYK